MSATLDVNHLLVTGNVTEVISRERNQGVLLVLTSSSFTQGSVDLLLTCQQRFSDFSSQTEEAEIESKDS